MLIRTWSRSRLHAVWVFAFVASMPAAAQAQQTGLFPLRPIRRERVPCAAEDPIYRMHREQYYGYFPTCWRRFPPGWGCLSPEAPDPAASFAKYKRTPPPEMPDLGSDDEPEGGMPPEEPGLGPRPNGEGRPAPSPLPPPPAGGRDLFELDNKAKPEDAPANPPGAGGSANRSVPPANRTAAVAPPLSAEVGLAPREAPVGDEPNEPLAGLPEPPAAEAPPMPAVNPLAPVVNPLAPVDTEVPPGTVTEPAPSTSSLPDQAPPRRSLLGSLFGGRRRR